MMIFLPIENVDRKIINFPAEIWKNIKYEIRETFQKYFGAKLLNQIDNVVIIENKVWY